MNFLLHGNDVLDLLCQRSVGIGSDAAVQQHISKPMQALDLGRVSDWALLGLHPSLLLYASTTGFIADSELLAGMESQQ